MAKKIQKAISREEQEELHQLMNEHENFTGYKYDPKDRSWNELVGRYACAKLVCKEFLLPICKIFTSLALAFFLLIIVCKIFGNVIYASFLIDFAVRTIYFFSTPFLLCFVTLGYLGPLGIAYFNMEKKISIPTIFYKTIKMSSLKQQFIFLAHMFLILGLLMLSLKHY